MQPLELTVEGFRSHREAHVFTFEGRSLFGIVGPIGSGKSSILDALIYALYGKTPKLERDTRKLVNSSSDDARIRLVFEADERVWEVTRVLRRKGASQVVLKRRDLEEDPESGERNVNARIEEILGLDFDAFCRSVTLPQGEFDRFLVATPKDRSTVLKGVFRLERVDAIREAAKVGGAELSGDLKAKEGQAEVLREKSEDLDDLRSSFEEEQKRTADLVAGAAEVSDSEAAIERDSREAEGVRREMDQLEQALETIPPAEEIGEIVDREDGRAKARTAAEKALAGAAQAYEAAHAAAHRTEEELGGEALVQARTLVSERARLARQAGERKKELEAVAEQVAALEENLREQRAVAEEAARARQSASEALDEARRRHAAHVVRESLEEGKPCPVCEQEVGSLPQKRRPPTLEKAEAAHEKAARVESDRARALASAEKDLAGKTALLRSAKEALEAHEAESASVEDSLKAILGKGDPDAELARRREVVEAAAAKAEEARRIKEQREKELHGAREDFEKVAAERRRLAGVLIGACARLDVDPPSIEAEAPDLASSAKKASEAAELKLTTLRKRIEEIEESSAEHRRRLEAFRKRFGLEEGESAAEAMARAHESLGSLRKTLEGAEAAAASLAGLIEEIEDLKGRSGLFTRLASDLTDAKFIRYLLDEQRRLLSRLGSERLMELTGGRYGFSDDGEFHIHDLAHGHVRTADTLSGGETFLASLALALALAEAVSHSGSRLGCFFLDEGFGSLDPESLNLALEGIERLASPARLIGLISHVRDLQTHLDDLVILERANDGSTKVLQTEGPISYALPPI